MRVVTSFVFPGQDAIPAQGEAVRASPDDLSSPGPDQADPLLQAQQTPARGGQSQPDSAEKTDAEATVDAKERSDHTRTAGAAGEEPAGEGQTEGEREDPKEPADTNNNSMEPQNCQENFITIPEISEAVSGEVSFNGLSARSEDRPSPRPVPQVERAQETFCSDEVKVVLVDSSGPGPASCGPDERDAVKIAITASCVPQMEESVKQVGGTLHPPTQNPTQHHALILQGSGGRRRVPHQDPRHHL